MTSSRLEFGVDVIVAAEVVRIIGQCRRDTVAYKQSASGRDGGRFVRHDFEDGGPWPGAPIGVDWEDAGAGFDPQQPVDDGLVLVRLRRIIHRVPAVGIVIGHTRRQEGRILPGRKTAGDVDGDGAQLAGPGRTISLVELALQPQGSPKARIVLAHPNDLQPIRQPVHQPVRRSA